MRHLTRSRGNWHWTDTTSDSQAHAPLAGKAYWEGLKESPDFVVLFLPGESSFAAALKSDPTLFEESMERGVVITTL